METDFINQKRKNFEEVMQKRERQGRGPELGLNNNYM
jgi:hypothetical protein